ncbi:MAG: hypothetical protein V2I63_05200 [Pseudomonadales bacterium]|jgi:hypothetical protein|nr:hypothetical protein [Pseudomonadales bacterium]
MTDPVEKYYEDKKRRYLTDLREAAANMKTGTPHDWEDADAYLQEVEDATAPDAEKTEKTEKED